MKLGYRADIDGLRAIAVMGVLLFHAGMPGLSGGFVGVDIFFVISGYLITSILIYEQDKTGRIDFLNFWARRTRRLFPSALLVIIVTLVISWFILTGIDFYYAVRDAIWASVYFINWTKLFSAVQYFDEGGKEGPFLHYWSLAVEEQFYLFMTIIFLLTVNIKKAIKKLSWNTGKIIIALVVLSSLISFTANIYYIQETQPIAFFSSPTRIWQLGLGATISFVERSNFIPSNQSRQLASWLGILMMAAAITLLDSNFAYPGICALLPSLGAAIFIFACSNEQKQERALPSRFLSMKLPVAIGKTSYSLYLWHWLVFILWKTHYKTWSVVDVFYTLVITFALSIITYFMIENPVRFSRVLSKRPVTSLCGAITLSVGFVVFASQIQNRFAAQNLIILNNGEAFVAEAIRKDLPEIYRSNPSCHIGQRDTDLLPCQFGKTDSNKSIMIFGDSHMAQWFAPIEKLANEKGLKLYSRTKSSCASVDIKLWNNNWKREYTECNAWRDKVMHEIKRIKPDIVVLANASRLKPIDGGGNRLEGQERIEAFREAERATIERIRQTGSKVLLIQDTPWHSFDPFSCLQENKGSTENCRTPVSEALSTNSPWSVNINLDVQGVYVLEMNEHFCDKEYCYVANEEFVLVRDKHHVSKIYSLALFQPILNKLETAGLFSD